MSEEVAECITGTRKIVVNRCYGGFSLSEAGVMLYAKLKGLTVYSERDEKSSFTTYWIVPPEDRLPEPSQADWQAWPMDERTEYIRKQDAQEINDRKLERDDPALVETVETLGAAANGMCAQLDVTAIPADVEWQIEEYDGREWIAERHRTW